MQLSEKLCTDEAGREDLGTHSERSVSITKRLDSALLQQTRRVINHTHLPMCNAFVLNTSQVASKEVMIHMRYTE